LNFDFCDLGWQVWLLLDLVRRSGAVGGDDGAATAGLVVRGVVQHVHLAHRLGRGGAAGRAHHLFLELLVMLLVLPKKQTNNGSGAAAG